MAVFESKRGYDEATHAMSHVYNLLLGGSGIEDIDTLQADEGVRRIVGADQLRDPTTAGCWQTVAKVPCALTPQSLALLASPKPAVLGCTASFGGAERGDEGWSARGTLAAGC